MLLNAYFHEFFCLLVVLVCLGFFFSCDFTEDTEKGITLEVSTVVEKNLNDLCNRYAYIIRQRTSYFSDKFLMLSAAPQSDTSTSCQENGEYSFCRVHYLISLVRVILALITKSICQGLSWKSTFIVCYSIVIIQYSMLVILFGPGQCMIK